MAQKIDSDVKSSIGNHLFFIVIYLFFRGSLVKASKDHLGFRGLRGPLV